MPVRRMVCVCLLGTRVSLAKTDELIVSRFGGSHVWVQNVVGPVFPTGSGTSEGDTCGTATLARWNRLGARLVEAAA